MTTDKVVISNLQNKDFSSSATATLGENQLEFWTIEYLVDKLFLRLVEVKETVINNNEEEIHISKYYEQARELLKWIPVARPSPAFIVYISDLTPELKAQLKELIAKSPDNLPYVLTEAVGRIFENLDFAYYHMSIAKNLKVKLQK